MNDSIENDGNQSPAITNLSSDSIIPDMRLEGDIPEHIKTANAFQPESFQPLEPTNREELMMERMLTKMEDRMATLILKKFELAAANRQYEPPRPNNHSPIFEPSNHQRSFPTQFQPPIQPRHLPPQDGRIQDRRDQEASRGMPSTYSDFKDRKEPRVCAAGKFNPKKFKAGVWLSQFKLWAGTQFTNLHPDVCASRTVESFGASMGTEETQGWFALFLENYPRAHPEQLYEGFRNTFISIQDQLQSASLVQLNKCQQRKNESVKAFNNRFIILNRQYQEAIEQSGGVYDTVGVRRAYLKNLFLPDVAKKIYHLSHLDIMMTAADQCALRLYELYLARHGGNTEDPYEDPEESSEEDLEIEKSISFQSSSKVDPKVVIKAATPSLTTRSNGTKIKTPSQETASPDINALMQEFDKLKILLNKNMRQPPRTAGPSTSRYSGEKIDLADKQCFNCQQFGHYVRDCKEPRTARTILVEQMMEDGVDIENFDVRCYHFGYIDVEVDF